MPVFAQDVRQSNVPARNSVTLRTELGIVDVNVLYHSLLWETVPRRFSTKLSEMQILSNGGNRFLKHKRLLYTDLHIVCDISRGYGSQIWIPALVCEEVAGDGSQ